MSSLSSSPRSSPRSSVRPAGILVVDDDTDLRELIRFVFADAGYTVIEASNGHKALDALCACQQPMVVLLDGWMPVMNGMDFLRAVAVHATLATRHRFILLTAANTPTPTLRDQFPSTMSVQALRKPFELVDLLARVAQLCDEIARTPAPNTPSSSRLLALGLPTEPPESALH